MKKQLATAVIAALLALPVGSGVALAETATAQTTTVSSTTTSTSTSADLTAAPAATAGDAAVSDAAAAAGGTAAAGTTTDTSAGAAADTSSGTTGTTTSDSSTAGSTLPASGEATGTPLPPVQDGDGNTVQPGTQPDSPFYWLVQLVQKVQLALTFDPAKKAAWLERHALEDLAAAKRLAQDGKTDAAQKALNAYADKVERATQFLDQLKDPNSAAAQTVVAALEKSHAANVAVLTGLLDKLPPQAAERVALNVVKALEKAVAKAEKAKNKEGTDAPGSVQGTGNGTSAQATGSAGSAGTAVAATSGAQAATPDDAKKLEAEAKSALARLKKALENSQARPAQDLNQAEDKNDQDGQGGQDDNKAVQGNAASQPGSALSAEKRAAVAAERDKGQQGSSQSQANARRPASAGEGKNHVGERDKGEQGQGRSR